MREDKIDINNYDYLLEESRIAKYPIEHRDRSKLLICKPGKDLNYKQFDQISEELPNGCLLVFNNTKVIHARIEFRKNTGAQIEIFCLSPVQPSDYQLMFSAKKQCTWNCMVGNLKKWKGGSLSNEFKIHGDTVRLDAEICGTDEKGNPFVQFNWNRDYTFAEILEEVGKIPIPPYLKRKTEDIDSSRYQTVYSKYNGSVAAPTAGLHFTQKVFDNLKQKQIVIAEVTLHVGAGTFQPVKTNNALEHFMHGEQFIVSKELIRQLLLHNKHTIAVGTTTLRTLESIYWLGIKILQQQNPERLEQWFWKESHSEISKSQSLNAILEYLENENREFLISTTEIMIVPDYDFKIIDGIITNFHQPKSTLLLLISALIGERWKEVYEYALENDFRFLSYGDSSLLFKK